MVDVIHTKMGGGRRVAIPAELCQEYGLKPGTPLVLETTDTGIVIRPLEAVIRDVQAFFADAAPNDVVLSEELLKDRRAEVLREAHD